MLNKRYSGIGSRKTPPEILKVMTSVASFLETMGYILFSGGADGADSAFESGVLDPDHKKIFLPWKDFNGNKSEFYKISVKAVRIAREYHPTWDFLPKGAKKLIARNGYQVLDESLDCPVDMVVCFTPNGKSEGGTGQALRIATKYNIPVYNLYFKEDLKQILAWIDTGELNHIRDARLVTWSLM